MAAFPAQGPKNRVWEDGGKRWQALYELQKPKQLPTLKAARAELLKLAASERGVRDKTGAAAAAPVNLEDATVVYEAVLKARTDALKVRTDAASKAKANTSKARESDKNTALVLTVGGAVSVGGAEKRKRQAPAVLQPEKISPFKVATSNKKHRGGGASGGETTVAGAVAHAVEAVGARHKLEIVNLKRKAKDLEAREAALIAVVRVGQRQSTLSCLLYPTSSKRPAFEVNNESDRLLQRARSNHPALKPLFSSLSFRASTLSLVYFKRLSTSLSRIILPLHQGAGETLQHTCARGQQAGTLSSGPRVVRCGGRGWTTRLGVLRWYRCRAHPCCRQPARRVEGAV